jgi:hypothetical protein
MAEQLAVASGRAAASARRASIYDWIPSGFINGLFFRVLLLLAPIQSVLLLPVQGSTPAFLMVLLCPAILVRDDSRYMRLLAFYLGFILFYAILLALSLSGYLIDMPDMSRLTVIREVYIFGQLKQTHITQGVYLFTAAVFTFIVYQYYQEAFLKYAYIGVLLLAAYGFYEFVFYALFHVNGDLLSNRNFGDLDTAAAGAGRGSFATGSAVQQSNLFGPNFMRLKSLVGEPSMYALTVTPFAVYAYGRRWWIMFAILALSLVLSTSTTAVIGLLVGLFYIETRRRPEAIVYVTGAIIIVTLLYATADPVRRAIDTLLFEKLDTLSGNERLRSFFDHVMVPFDGNPIRALFGLGFGTVRATDMLSNLMANVGVVGFLLYSAVLIVPCFLLRRGEDCHALVATLLAIYFMEMITVSEYAYLPPWFMIALGYVRARQQRLALPAPAR